MKKEIKFSLVYRDMWQSSGKYQPRADQLAKIAPLIVEMGCFARVETNGGAFEQVNLLYGENPNKAVRTFTKPLREAGIQTHMLDRGLNALRMYPVPADVRRLMYKVKHAQGVDITRIFCGLNEVRNMFGKKLVQTVSYLPHFLSWIIVTGILHDALSSTGIINELLVNLGIVDSPINFFANPGYFWPIVAFANVWKETGWNAIVYLAAITSIDPSLYEAATLDGAGRWGKIWHVTLPGIKSTIMILLIMNIGNVLNAGFEVQYLLGNGLVKSVSETIDIYTLTWGISQNDYSLGTAAGIFKSVVAIILILGANWIAKRAGEDRLF